MYTNVDVMQCMLGTHRSAKLPSSAGSSGLPSSAKKLTAGEFASLLDSMRPVPALTASPATGLSGKHAANTPANSSALHGKKAMQSKAVAVSQPTKTGTAGHEPTSAIGSESLTSLLTVLQTQGPLLPVQAEPALGKQTSASNGVVGRQWEGGSQPKVPFLAKALTVRGDRAVHARAPMGIGQRTKFVATMADLSASAQGNAKTQPLQSAQAPPKGLLNSPSVVMDTMASGLGPAESKPMMSKSALKSGFYAGIQVETAANQAGHASVGKGAVTRILSPVEIARQPHVGNDITSAELATSGIALRNDIIAPTSPAVVFAKGADPLPTTQHVVDVSSPHAALQLSQAVLQSLKNGDMQLQVKVQPEGMGQMLISVTQTAGQMHVSVAASQMSTYQWLQQNSGNLTQALQASGVQLSDVQLSFGQASMGSGGFGGGQEKRNPQTPSSRRGLSVERVQNRTFEQELKASDGGLLNVQV